MWLLVLLTPINGLFSLQAGFEIPTGDILGLLVLGIALILAGSLYLLILERHKESHLQPA